jgi:DNA mismatch repair protein MutH
MLAGRPLSWLANRLGRRVPVDQRRDKGWAGNLVEEALGATAGNRAECDFPKLGVELKTVPMDATGRVLQATYVCTAPTAQAATWDASWVRKKLACVLWVPIVGTDALGDRRLGSPVMWTPSPDEDALLCHDWEELSELLHRGEVHLIDARMGKVLQLRPKGANRDDHHWVLSDQAEWVRAMPRGFYLRARFTSQVLGRHLTA